MNKIYSPVKYKKVIKNQIIESVKKSEKQEETPYDDSEIVQSITESEKTTNENFKGPNWIPEGPPGYDDDSVPQVNVNKASIKNIKDTEFNTEQYDKIVENNFKNPIDDPLSTFSIDVDTASYSNIRRFLQNDQMPYKDAVRIEEMINYFSYDYRKPVGDKPFEVNMEISECPWKDGNKLLLIGIQGKVVNLENLPPSNLVFLIDVSGSMQDENKLPLLKESLKLLVDQMREEDKISIVVYAGSSGLVLPSTSGYKKNKIKNSIDNLEAGGSTAGGEGIKLAYKIANENFIKNGNNRIILSTDGDFNVGPSSDGELVRMIEEERKSGVYLTILGFGMGNYKDSKMEKLADSGNGNYAYIDTLNEAKKVLVNQMAGTLLTIAKDVKLQIEFNPVIVKEYRLLGYENRILNKEDFEDDKKDAGEIGAGHTVTALYELVISKDKNKENNLKYQKTEIKNESFTNNEAVFVKIRYKRPNSNSSNLLEFSLQYNPIDFIDSSNNLQWAAVVAEFGLLLRESKFKGNANYEQVLDISRRSKGEDREGYRKEFIDLVKKTRELAKDK
jgi:Ca-activated chloride channel family protein